MNSSTAGVAVEVVLLEVVVNTVVIVAVAGHSITAVLVLVATEHSIPAVLAAAEHSITAVLAVEEPSTTAVLVLPVVAH